MHVKHDILIESDLGGFVETHWSSTGETLLQRLGQLEWLANLRSRFLLKPYKIVEIRVSNLAVLNDSLVRYSGLGTSTITEAEAKHPDAAVLVRLSSSSIYWSPIHLRGLPLNVTLPYDQTLNGVKPFVDGIKLWKKALIDGNRGWAVRTLSRALGDSPYEAVTIAPDTVLGNLATRVSPNTRTLVAGESVRISLRKAQYGPFAAHYRGIAKVISTAAGSFLIDMPFPTDFVYKDKGIIIPQRYIFSKIIQVQEVRLVRRKAGQDFSTAKGRRKRSLAV